MIPIDKDYIDFGYLIKEYREKGSGMIWTMKDGTEIIIKEMKTLHIKKCISMLSKLEQTGIRKSWIYIFEDVLDKRRTEKIIKIQENIRCKKYSK